MSTRLRPVPAAAPRAILYKRQSTYREESISLELQEQADRDYCERHGYLVAHVIEDAGVSGLKWEKRPGIQEVLRLLRDGEADVVVVYRWSRLSRHRLHQALALDAIERAGARVESATEPFDTETAAGGFGRDVLLAAAHYEAQLKGEQWREAHERRLAKGLPSRGGPRFGYVRAGDTYLPDPATGPLLAGMYADYLDGTGFVTIAKRLNQAGVTTISGGVWSSERVADVLDSGFGGGQLAIGKRRNITYRPGAQQPVIDPDVWEAYREARDSRRGAPGSNRPPVYPLSGLLRCGDCGSSMHATALGRETGYGYMCGRWAKTGQGRCVTVSRAKAERVVQQWLAVLAGEIEQSAAREEVRAARQLVARTDATDLRRQILRLDGRMTKLTAGWTDGLVSDREYASTRDELAAQREVLVERARDAEAKSKTLQQPAGPVVTALLESWDTSPPAALRDLLGVVIARVVVDRPARGPVLVRVVPVEALGR